MRSLSARRAWIEIGCFGPAGTYPPEVALRKESVDRNFVSRSAYYSPSPSLSARRAWIEIDAKADSVSQWTVALRKESVDRNTSIDNLTQGVFKSLSARRAWIEMIMETPWRYLI